MLLDCEPPGQKALPPLEQYSLTWELEGGQSGFGIDFFDAREGALTFRWPQGRRR